MVLLLLLALSTPSSSSTSTLCQVHMKLSRPPIILNYSVEGSRPNYRVLATDYLNFAIVYDCLDIFGLFKAESLWFLTRSQFPDQSLVDEGYR